MFYPKDWNLFLNIWYSLQHSHRFALLKNYFDEVAYEDLDIYIEYLKELRRKKEENK